MMKNFFEYRGKTAKLVFDTQSKQFVVQTLPHPFLEQTDAHATRLLADVGIAAQCDDEGKLKLKLAA